MNARVIRAVCFRCRLLCKRVVGDVVDSIRAGEDLVRLGVGNLNTELLLERHHYLYGVQAIETQIAAEGGGGGHLGWVHLVEHLHHLQHAL
eukprot:4477867-Pyramimonas_sp.AAC.1